LINDMDSSRNIQSYNPIKNALGETGKKCEKMRFALPVMKPVSSKKM
jgi:hypothetical protein